MTTRQQRRVMKLVIARAEPKRIRSQVAPAGLLREILATGQPHVDDARMQRVVIYGGVKPETARVANGYTRTHLTWKRPVFNDAGEVVGLQ